MELGDELWESLFVHEASVRPVDSEAGYRLTKADCQREPEGVCQCVHVCTCSSGSGSLQPVGTQPSGAFMSRCQQLETPEDPAASSWTDGVSKSSCWRDLYYIHVCIPCSQAFILISQMGEQDVGAGAVGDCMRAVFWSLCDSVRVLCTSSYWETLLSLTAVGSRAAAAWPLLANEIW